MNKQKTGKEHYQFIQDIMPGRLWNYYKHGGENNYRRIPLAITAVMDAWTEFKGVAVKMTARDLRALLNALRQGKFSGVYNVSDLPGIISIATGESGMDVINRIGYRSDFRSSPLAFWLYQICGGKKPSEDDFVDTTAHWVRQELATRPEGEELDFCI